MATLNFSFAGESIKAAKLESTVRKFELEFENPAYAGLGGTPFSVEYFFSINRYAEDLSEAFHMAAKEAGIIIDHLSLSITGSLDSRNAALKPGSQGSMFDKIDVALIITSDASDAVLVDVFRIANELSPAEEAFSAKARLRFTLNTIVHLN